MNSFTRKVLADAAALTSTPVASTAELCADSDQFGLYLKYTPAASGRVLTITIEVSPSGINTNTTTDANADWHQYGEYDYTDADTKGQTQFDIKYTSTGTSAVYLAPFIFACPADRIRIKYDQSGASGGTLTATLLYRASEI